MKGILLYFIIFSAGATESFCFQRNINLEAVKRHVLTITSPQDRVYIQEKDHCLEIDTSPTKRELLQKWIGKKYQTINIPSSLSPSQDLGKPCLLAVEKTMKEDSKTKEFSVGQRNAFQETIVKGSGTSTSSLVLGKGSQGFIQVNDQRVELTCVGAGSNAYQVKVSLASLNQALATQVRVLKGQKMNLGQVVEDLNKEAVSKGIPLGYRKKKRQGQATFEYFLQAK